MSSPTTQPGAAQTPADKAGESGRPDAQRLQAQLAGLVEGGGPEGDGTGEMRPVLEFLRAMLNARAIGLLPVPGPAATFEPCLVTTRGILASTLSALAASLEKHELTVRPAPELGPEGVTVAVPVLRERTPFGWLLAQLAVPNPRDLQAYIVLLQALTGFLLYREQRRRTGDLLRALEQSSHFLEVFRAAAAEPDGEKAARIAVDGLRECYGGARVSFGSRRRDGFHLRAISGVARVDTRSPAHQPVETAMREALFGGTRVEFRPDSPRTAETVAHELLLEQTGASQLVTLPGLHRRAAILLEWPADRPPTGDIRRLLEAGAPLVPALFDVLERARPHPLVFTLRRHWEKLTDNRRRAVIVGAGAFLVLLGWPFHYSIRADCRIAPTVKRVVAAPYQGILKKSLVRPGDAVTAGQALAEMDNRDLKLKEAELIAARDRALKQRDKAMTNDGEGADFAAAQLASLEAQAVSRELDLVQRRLASLTIPSPTAGVVLSGDLRRAEGQPLQQGEVLFEVAPLEDLLVEIDVPDRELSRVRPGLPARFRLEAFAGKSWSSELTKVHPQSEQRDGRNVFLAEAVVPYLDRQFDPRPGMRGRAVISGDRRPLLWILGHRLWEFVVRTLFW